MTDPVAVPGFDGDFVRVLTALEVVELIEGGGTDGVRGSVKFAQLCGVTQDGEPLWPTLADAESEEWPRIKASALTGFALNGLTAEGASGN